MCLSSALVGVLVFLRRKSLIGEALSHASYPGVVMSAFFVTLFAKEFLPLVLLGGAFLTALLGLFCIEKLEKLKVRSDAALCFVLSLFFGVGVLMASRLQTVDPLSFQGAQIFLYGQAATMMESHVWIYGLLSLVIMGCLAFLYRPIEIMLFDRSFARSIGMSFALLDLLLFILLVLAIIIGIRSVGVVLMVGMLIAPAVTARQFSDRLGVVFILAAFFGTLSGFLGNYFSIQLPLWGGWLVGERQLVLPTGPMILLSASSLCILSLCFSPKRGLLFRWVRALVFRQKCVSENILKQLWKRGQDKHRRVSDLRLFHLCPQVLLRPILRLLIFQGWLLRTRDGGYQLSADGAVRASHIVRLHRLWEVYLVSLGQGREKVHHSAEEMEHILTPEIEKELTALLKDPKHDPHAQPIPTTGGMPR